MNKPLKKFPLTKAIAILTSLVAYSDPIQQAVGKSKDKNTQEIRKSVKLVLALVPFRNKLAVLRVIQLPLFKTERVSYQGERVNPSIVFV